MSSFTSLTRFCRTEVSVWTLRIRFIARGEGHRCMKSSVVSVPRGAGLWLISSCLVQFLSALTVRPISWATCVTDLPEFFTILTAYPGGTFTRWNGAA
ncbi:hypothetical protein OV203_47400 [Nannocystis sp. ILAH1]|uniref:hypothetical protein n=1 Tax=unclassified Nannocystis TaxID=2627009 RepID=UPI00226F16AD|nr:MULTISPECIES: hypothetical protein [unclassified Nannocystis]MCY0994845.1 hypothetical protein [Nannocystis sp. ILAH1]MCY1065325.1 hypothetical protein [Nannocystis sp. RBIL2]